MQRRRRFRVQTADSGHPLPVAPGLPAQHFTVGRPDEAWTADVTYVPTEGGRPYVAAIKDLFAGEVVGLSFGEGMTADPAEYIGLFYNRQRRQARLGYSSPAAYTRLFTRRQRAA